MEFEVTHTPDGLRTLYRALWRRRFGNWSLLAWAVAIGSALLMLAAASAPWYAVAAFTASVLFVAWTSSARDSATGFAIALLRRLDPPTLHLRLTDEALHETTSVSSSELRWSEFERVDEVDGHLVLIRRPKEAQMFVALPLAALPAGAREFIEAHVGAAPRAPR